MEQEILKSPEPVKIPESKPEQTREKQAEVKTEKEPVVVVEKQEEILVPKPTTTAAPVVAGSQTQQQIHAILNEDLEDYLTALPENKRNYLLKEQQKVESTLEMMVNKLVDKAQKILNLILEWLKKIPGLDSFFQMQEAKTKTEKIIRLIEEKKRV